jgi:VWFA-related protein
VATHRLKLYLCLAALLPTAFPARQAIDPVEIIVRKQVYAPRTGYTFRSDAALVEVGAVVRDNIGRTVSGLQKENFEILENGVARDITSFSVLTSSAPVDPAVTARPRHVALVFDDILVKCSAAPATRSVTSKGGSVAIAVGGCGTNFADFQIMKTAAQKYLHQGLAKGDQVTLIGLYAGQLVDFTTDSEKLAAGLSTLNARWQSQKPPADTFEDLTAVVKYLARIPGDRLLLLVSGGLRTSGRSPYIEELVAEALRGGVSINCLDIRGLVASGDATDPAMNRISSETGGEYFHNNNDMIRGLRETIAPNVKYLLGFARPDVHDGKYHSLKVKVTGPHKYAVAARPGYVAPTAEEEAESQPGPLDLAAVSPEIRTDLAARITLQPQHDAASSSLDATAHIDLSAVAFREADHHYNQQVRYVAVLFDDTGAYITGKEAIIDLALRDTTLQHLKEAGIGCTLHLSAPPGAYRLRTVVREENGAMATNLQAVKIE